MELPKIEFNKFGVVCCNKGTGVIVDLDWTPFIKRQATPMRVFSSESEVLNFILSTQREKIEFLIYDHNHELIDFIY